MEKRVVSYVCLTCEVVADAHTETDAHPFKSGEFIIRCENCSELVSELSEKFSCDKCFNEFPTPLTGKLFEQDVSGCPQCREYDCVTILCSVSGCVADGWEELATTTGDYPICEKHSTIDDVPIS